VSTSTTTLQLRLGGLIAVHAARAAQTALGAVPQILTATVTMSGAIVDVSRPVDLPQLERDVRLALEPVDIELLEVILVQNRVLPLA
jgi:hypothetical protein